MLTTANLVTFLQLREGFRKHAYDDKHPSRKLTAETEIEGTLTIGFGTTEYPDGRKVEWDDKVTKSEALDYLNFYIQDTIEPALENLIHRPLAGCQYDALGSCIYQYGESEVASWNLIRLINGNASWEEIAREWINGTVMWGGEPLFWGRRISELFMFFDLDWMAGGNVPVLSDVIAAIKLMGFEGNMPQPEPIKSDILFEPETDMSDPTPETPMTMEDRQFLSAKAVGYDGTYADFMGHRTVVTKRNAIEAPKIDTTKPPKPMEDSKTHRGLAKETAGKESMTLGGTLAGTALTAATVRDLTRDAGATVENVQPILGGFTLGHLILIGLAFGGAFAAWGAFRAFRGWQIKREGRRDGTQLKV
tara:strand:+ start:5435 stop:6523 length:1089 start_codon:yes stop_codon:yes gene_type:complete